MLVSERGEGVSMKNSLGELNAEEKTLSKLFQILLLETLLGAYLLSRTLVEVLVVITLFEHALDYFS